MRQIPHGPKDRHCPFWRKPMDKVCHVCPMWTQVRGKDPQSNSEFDDWNCALGWLPTLILETAQQSRQAGASADKVATEVRNFRSDMVELNLRALPDESNGRPRLERQS